MRSPELVCSPGAPQGALRRACSATPLRSVRTLASPSAAAAAARALLSRGPRGACAQCLRVRLAARERSVPCTSAQPAAIAWISASVYFPSVRSSQNPFSAMYCTLHGTAARAYLDTVQACIVVVQLVENAKVLGECDECVAERRSAWIAGSARRDHEPCREAEEAARLWSIVHYRRGKRARTVCNNKVIVVFGGAEVLIAKVNLQSLSLVETHHLLLEDRNGGRTERREISKRHEKDHVCGVEGERRAKHRVRRRLSTPRRRAVLNVVYSVPSVASLTRRLVRTLNSPCAASPRPTLSRPGLLRASAATR